LAVLVEVMSSEEAADSLLDRALSASALDSRDRGLAVELCYGVLRRLRTLDWRLEPVLDKPLARLPILVQMTLRLGAYQILYLDRIPHSAAVNESVNLVKQAAKNLRRDWSGLVNAVLRSLIRAPARPLPSIETNAASALAVKHSVPEWLSRRWIERLGIEQAEAACAQASTIPPVTVRVHQLRFAREDILARLQNAGIAARPTSISPFGITVEGGGPVSSLPGFLEGAYYVEDEAAQLVPPLLAPHPGETVLDACAAPGGKSIHLAEMMHNRGRVYSLDKSPKRLGLLRDNCQRLGATIVHPLQGDARKGETWSKETGPLDRALVDAPCSGLGVLRRHPEAKWRKDSAAFDRHHRLQLDILTSVAARLRPGGVLVYSTCSTEPEETTSVIDEFLRTHAGFQRQSVAPWLPDTAHRFLTEQGDLSTLGNQFSMDGFFAARLRKQP
jgi:16S rRNA (cytosine967-C5)-methyltransferase